MTRSTSDSSPKFFSDDHLRRTSCCEMGWSYSCTKRRKICGQLSNVLRILFSRKSMQDIWHSHSSGTNMRRCREVIRNPSCRQPIRIRIRANAIEFRCVKRASAVGNRCISRMTRNTIRSCKKKIACALDRRNGGGRHRSRGDWRF